MPPRSIVHVVPGLDTGGAEMMLFKLLGKTDRDRWQPALVSLRDRGTLGDRIEGLDIRVATVGMRRSVPGVRDVWRLRCTLAGLTPSLIHGWMYHGNLAALVGRALLWRWPPVVWCVRSLVFDFASEKRLTATIVRLGALLSSGAVRIVYNSRASARQHAEVGFPKEGAVVIPNGFDTERFAPSANARAAVRRRLGVNDAAILVGRIGRYHPVKDYPAFLRAAALLAMDRPQVRFVLAGPHVDEHNSELTRLIEALGIGPSVYLLGDVSAVGELMPALDILCSSSAYGESFPNVLGEAMSCGVPCVTTDLGDASWIVGESGRVVPPRDPIALAAACRELVDGGTEVRGRLGAVARARVVREFSLDRVVAQYESLYREILDSGGKTEDHAVSFRPQRL